MRPGLCYARFEARVRARAYVCVRACVRAQRAWVAHALRVSSGSANMWCAAAAHRVSSIIYQYKKLYDEELRSTSVEG
eukprot:6177794-Pleurochrysis_carterae.AAC.4